MLFTFPANSRRECFSVSTNEDDLLEADEVFNLIVSLASAVPMVSIDPNGDTATVTITNDDCKEPKSVHNTASLLWLSPSSSSCGRYTCGSTCCVRR